MQGVKDHIDMSIHFANLEWLANDLKTIRDSVDDKDLIAMISNIMPELRKSYDFLQRIHAINQTSITNES